MSWFLYWVLICVLILAGMVLGWYFLYVATRLISKAVLRTLKEKDSGHGQEK